MFLFTRFVTDGYYATARQAGLAAPRPRGARFRRDRVSSVRRSGESSRGVEAPPPRSRLEQRAHPRDDRSPSLRHGGHDAGLCGLTAVGGFGLDSTDLANGVRRGDVRTKPREAPRSTVDLTRNRSQHDPNARLPYRRCAPRVSYASPPRRICHNIYAKTGSVSSAQRWLDHSAATSRTRGTRTASILGF